MSTISALLLSLTVAATPNPRGEVIDFSATWCGPCQAVAPIVKKLEREGQSIRTVDIDQDQALTQKYNVNAMPTFVLVVDGREVERHVGGMTEQQLRGWLAKIPKEAETPVSPVSVEQPGATRPKPFVADPNVDLGAPSPFARSLADSNVRPAPLTTVAPPAAPTEAPRKRSLWPFGRSEQPVVQPEIRGNDDRIGLVSLDAPEGVAADPMQASVRLRVTIGGSVNLGSGTIVYSVAGRALIVTCGHIFRGVTEDSKIEVDLLHGAEKQTVVGRVVDFDIDSEIGLIEIPSSELLPAAAVATVQSVPLKGDRVQSIGCDGGALPTVMPIEVTAVDLYEGASTVECTGVPVQGRSGGGLFNRNGELIGVCFAADPQQKRGIYTGLSVVQSSLRSVGLGRLFELPTSAPTPQEGLVDAGVSGGAAPDVSSMFSSEPVPSRSPVAPSRFNGNRFDPPQDGSRFDGTRAQNTVASADAPRNLSSRHDSIMSGESRLTGDSEALGSMAEEAEIVVIVRPKNQPEGASRVVIINEASPKLLAYLRGDSQSTEGTDSFRTAGATTLRRPQPLEASTRQIAVTTPFRASKDSIIPTTARVPLEPQRYVRSAESRRIATP